MPYKDILLLLQMKWAKILFIYYMFDNVTSNFQLLSYAEGSDKMTENLVDDHIWYNHCFQARQFRRFFQPSPFSLQLFSSWQRFYWKEKKIMMH